MSSTFFGLNIGTSGLFAYQAALNTVAHNIANAEATGYTRQVTNLAAGRAISVSSSYGMVGTGVTVSSIEQVRNSYYDAKYRLNSALYGKYSTKEYYMTQIENYFNEVDDDKEDGTGLTAVFNDLYEAMEELNNDPSNLTTRTEVTSYAETYAETINSLAESMATLQKECNEEVKSRVDQINALAQEIAVLTKQIISLENGGITANDLRDIRNNLVDELSEVVNVTVSEIEGVDGESTDKYLVYIDGQLLVDSTKCRQLAVAVREEKLNQTDADGLYDVVWDNGKKFDLNSSTLGGTLQALIEMRDGNNGDNLSGTVTGRSGDGLEITLTDTNVDNIAELNIPETGVITIDGREYTYKGFSVTIDDTGAYSYTFELSAPLSDSTGIPADAEVGESVNCKGIPYYMAQLNEYVRTYAMAYNAICNSGYDLNGDAGTNFFTGTDSVTGEELELEEEFTSFLSTEDSYYKLTAANFTVGEAVSEDPNLVVTSSDATSGVENSDIVDELIKLKTADLFDQGTATEFLESLVAVISVNSDKAGNFSKNQENILATIENQRLSISGVDTEEEAMNLIMYQQIYNLSCQVISVMDEIYDKLINEMAV